MIQIFGIKGSQATRAAERFFKERSATIQFVDLKQKPMAKAELKRFVDKFGLQGLIDIDSKPYIDDGLKYLKLTDDQLQAKIENEPRLLKLPLVRGPNRISIGYDEDAWKTMLAQREGHTAAPPNR